MATDPSRALMAPVRPEERIHAMDVLRGFALLGIALMNVEFFNRSSMEMGMGLAPGDTGPAHVAGWLVAWLVTGKFWVLFSLLFGMGFALMLQRARARGGDFLRLYLRRTLVLMGFGLLHGIGIWFGDILFGYAVVAAMLLLLWFGRIKHALLLAAALAVLALIPGLHALANLLVLVVVAMVVGSWIRAPEGRMPRAAWLLYGIGSAVVLGGLAMIPSDPGIAAMLLLLGVFLLGLGWLAARHRGPPQSRPLRAGVALYMLAPLLMIASAGMQAVKPDVFMPPGEEGRKEMDANYEKFRTEAAAEVAALRSPGYLDDIRTRATRFGDMVGMLPLMGTLALGVFLVGGWLLERGAIADPVAHARLWRGLLLAWPWCAAVVAIGLWLAPAMPAGRPPSWRGLLGLGLGMGAALPMALGYVAMVLRGLQGRLAPLLGALAPAGRMALTNYLLQSVICSFVFYGWGLHQWGMPRHLQVVFVFAMFLAQVLLSIAWMRHFRYGPMEWLWRWITYTRRPGAVTAAA